MRRPGRADDQRRHASVEWIREEVRWIRKEVSHAQYVEIESGHDLASEAPQALIAAVRQFLT